MKFRHEHKHGYFIAAVQVIFFILFCIFVRYHPDADARQSPLAENATDLEKKLSKKKSDDAWGHTKTYPMFQDVHIMILVGFGFLMMFLKKYSFSSVGVNFLLACICFQWAILMNGFFHLVESTILVDLNALLAADFTAAAILISFGVVLGKTTPTQLITMALIEVPVFVINEVIGRQYLGAIDMGDSMFVHAFGAYFGLSVSLMLHRSDSESEKEGSNYRSDLFAMVGTLFLWAFWPSFNSGAAPGDDQLRGIVNTYLALSACTLTSFAVSSLINKKKKFDMVHIQNSTLAGGVAIGTSADLMVHPWGAVLVGIIAGVISVVGYVYLTPFLNKHCRIHDTCGVHNLHGLPGIVAGIVGCILAAVASEANYGPSLYEIFPARAPEEGPELDRLRQYIPDLKPGSGRSAGTQATNQILALLISIVIAVVTGLLTGLLLRLKTCNKLKASDLFEDERYWLIEEGEEEYNSAGNAAIPMNTPADNGTSK